MEEVDSISVAVSNIDINRVEPLENRRLVAFINQFLCVSVTFLNQFATKCERKLDEIQQKLFRIESSLRILECKLDSIPETHLLPAVDPQKGQQGSKSESAEKSSSEESKSTSVSIPVPPPSYANAETQQVDKESSQNQKNHSQTEETSSPSVENNGDDDEDNNDNDEKPCSKQTLKDDPRYAKYFKMIQVGVPLPAVKQKMMSEGVDPSILD